MIKRLVLAIAFIIAAVGMCQDAEIVKVRGRGTGTDKIEALKDAYRDAVEQAVGLFVDAEQMVNHEELVKNQILTQSNAYIEKYKIAKEKTTADGLVTVTIIADVRKRDLTKKIRDVIPAQLIDLSDVSKNLHAQIVTDFKANDDAVSIIKNELEEFQPLKQLMKLSLASSKPVVESVEEDASLVRLWYPIKVEVDANKYYKEFAPRWSRILDQIKVRPANRLDLKNNSTYVRAYNDKVAEKYGTARKGRSGLMTKCEMPNSKGWPYEGCLENQGLALNEEYQGLSFFDARIHGKEYVLHGLFEFSRMPYFAQCALRDKPSRVKGCCIERTFTKSGRNCSLQEQIDGGCDFCIGLVTTANRQGLTGSLYRIPQGCIDEIVRWQHLTACGTTKGYEYRETAPEAEFYLRFLDDNSREIAGLAFSLRNLELINIGCVLLEEPEYSNGDYVGGMRLWLITPLIGGFATSYVKWVSVDMPKDDVAKITSATISVEE